MQEVLRTLSLLAKYQRKSLKIIVKKSPRLKKNRCNQMIHLALSVLLNEFEETFSNNFLSPAPVHASHSGLQLLVAFLL